MNGFNGRVCGGLGFGIKEPYVQVSVEFSNKLETRALYPEKVQNVVKILDKEFGLGREYKINVLREIKEHIGLGSETQLFLSVAKGIFHLNKIEMSLEEVCPLLGLGGVSGIGTGVFNMGGFIIDGGYSFGPGKDKELFEEKAKRTAKVLARYEFPKEWRVLLIIPKGKRSLSGEWEKKLFREHTPVPIKEVKDIAYYTLMGVQPAILERDFDLFIESLRKITKLGTKKAELKINKDITERILFQLEKLFGFGGLSSLGPACYSFINTNREKINLRKIKNLFQGSEVILTEVSNKPHQIVVNRNKWN